MLDRSFAFQALTDRGVVGPLDTFRGLELDVGDAGPSRPSMDQLSLA